MQICGGGANIVGERKCHTSGRDEVGNILSGFFGPTNVKIIYIMYGTRI